ncbi:MAG: 5-deoxy-glucuronate isomerase [Bryobacterales bacterium]|nr:5-deoxy-glucuronate isomerase [Bryobacteraceae bacterium]MDW8353208.1 5-deoxy-glucuronate isomerase [Bryobacterales bacterium]
MTQLRVKPLAGEESFGELVRVTQETAGWDTVSLRVVRLRRGQAWVHASPGEELLLVLLGGQAKVAAGGKTWAGIGGRRDVFSGMPHALYLPCGLREVRIEASSEVCEVAICGARAERPYEPVLIEPGSVEIEIRGGENATRQIHHILKPDFPADRIMVVEVYTPGGNWSSYPPHKHDEHRPPEEADLDEIYFYKLARPEGFAIQRVYTRDGRLDETLTVRHHEVVLIPEGYHPVVAAHGYDCYYLNVLAGSARSMAASDDPDYAWVRGLWRTKDPRLPLVRGTTAEVGS